jgi:hypothetical protein
MASINTPQIIRVFRSVVGTLVSYHHRHRCTLHVVNMLKERDECVIDTGRTKKFENRESDQ